MLNPPRCTEVPLGVGDLCFLQQGGCLFQFGPCIGFSELVAFNADLLIAVHAIQMQLTGRHGVVVHAEAKVRRVRRLNLQFGEPRPRQVTDPYLRGKLGGRLGAIGFEFFDAGQDISDRKSVV